MRCLLILIYNLIFFNICGFKIKIGQNIDKFIFDQWEEEKEKQYNYKMYIEDDASVKIKPDNLFLLLESVDYNEIYNKFTIYCLINNEKNKIYDITEPCNYDKIKIEIDFSGDQPKYKIDILNFTKNEDSSIKETSYDLTKDDILIEKTKIFLTDEEIKDNKKFESVKNIIKDLSANDKTYEEKGKKWALFKIKIKDIPSEKYFYCNDIESIYNVGGIFDKNIEEIEIIKSNCEDIYYMHCFTSQCRFLKKVDLTNLKTKDDIDINQMFYNCKNLKEVIFPKGLKVENIALLFSNSNNIEKINFEDLKIDNLYSMALLFKDSNIKKINFPNFKIKKDSKVCIDKNGLSPDKYKEKGILLNSDLEEIDLTNVEFEEGAGKNMFKKNTVKKLILPENMKKLSKQQLKDIFNDSDIKIIKIGDYELKIEEYDLIENFIKDPQNYLKGREMIKKLYYNEPIKNNNNNNNSDIDQDKIKNTTPNNSCINCCTKCFSSCCCCCKSKT